MSLFTMELIRIVVIGIVTMMAGQGIVRMAVRTIYEEKRKYNSDILDGFGKLANAIIEEIPKNKPEKQSE